MRGRNKSKLLSLLLYRLPSNYFWPSEQPVSTTIREEEGAGGSAVSTAASPTPSSPASWVQLYSQAEGITTGGWWGGTRGGVSSKKQMRCVSAGSYILRAFICQMLWLLSLPPQPSYTSVCVLLFCNFCRHRTSLPVASILADIQIQRKHPFWQAQAPATSCDQAQQGPD